MAGPGFDLVLCDAEPEICHQWRLAFRGERNVEIYCDDFFDMSADAYVSPANSHGIMDGGFDLLLRHRFPGVDVAVQRKIDELGGLLRVGAAIVVETGDIDVPYLVSAPTMERPSVIAHTNHSFLAMRALLRAVRNFNRDYDAAIGSVAVPGLGTGVGKMPPGIAARQMREGWDAFLSEL